MLVDRGQKVAIGEWDRVYQLNYAQNIASNYQPFVPPGVVRIERARLVDAIFLRKQNDRRMRRSLEPVHALTPLSSTPPSSTAYN